MVISSSDIASCPVVSLHVSAAIARIQTIVVDPNNLKVIAFGVDGPGIGQECGDYLEASSIRESSPFGLIIDSADELVFSEDVIQLGEILKLNFNLVGLKVETKKKSKLGKVVDYMIDTDGFSVVQLIVKRPTLKSFVDPELVIGRSTITEITDYKVIVRDEAAKTDSQALQDSFVPNFVNPFRDAAQNPPEPQTSPARRQTPDAPNSESTSDS